VTNASLPVTGSVTVGNLPLDSRGNVLVTVASDTVQYQFQSIFALPCADTTGILDFCTGPQSDIPIEQTLTTDSSQGYELVSVVPTPQYNNSGPAMLYTLRLLLTTRHKTGGVPASAH